MQVFLSSDREIYAADVLDAMGHPVLPRQVPYEKPVQLYMTNAGAPDEGAYVDVFLDPPESLELVPSDDTCVQLPGIFRCTAKEDGFANFVARSESTFNGEVSIKLIGRTETASFTVLPAGLPSDASNFQVIVEGLDSGLVPAGYNQLKCNQTATPDSTFNKWPEGKVRVREAEVRATAPSDQPQVLEHAPIIVQSLHPEMFVTRDPACPPPRNTRLRVQLDALGTSPKFYLCFSDLGGDSVQLSVASGAKGEVDVPTVAVDPEPHLLRIVTTKSEVAFLDGTQDVATLSAFDADLKKMKFTVDVRVESDPANLVQLAQTQVVLPEEGELEVPIQAEVLSDTAQGKATILVSPQFYDDPACSSAAIEVNP